jgi:hypothetical protein
MKSFEDLQALGANSIHERTHIARAKLEQLLHKSFDELNRVQFMGFVSILEREYGVDLDALRSEFDLYVGLHPDIAIAKSSVVLQASSNSRMWWIAGAFVAIVALMIIGWMMQGELSVSPKEEVIALNSATIAVLDTNSSDLNVSDVNGTNDINSTTEITAIPLDQEDNKSVESDNQSRTFNFGNVLSIKPASKVWVGMMDLATREKTQKVTRDPIVIDSTKNWLFIFGHGRLEMVTPSGSTMLKERNTVWFAYENGSLRQLTSEEFKMKNQGSNW